LTLPESNRTPPNLGVVKTLGLGWVSIDGTRVPFHVKEEDTIVYDPYKVMIVDLEHLGVNKSLHLIQHGNIMGIVEE
jgi:co-chaperonin GroES (HSP10)